MNRIIGKTINRFVVGLSITLFWGLAFGISAWVLKIPFTGSFADLYVGLSNIASIQGLALTSFWILSMVVLGFISYWIVKNRRHIEPYKAERDNDDLPNHVTILYLVLVATTISVALFLVNTLASVVDQSMASASLKTVYDGLMAGNILVLIPFFVFSTILGFIVVAVVGSGKIQKIAEDTGLNKA